MKAKFQQIADRVYPGSILIESRKLEGGVSAQVFALMIELSDGSSRKLVVRLYGEADLKANPHVATHEFELLRFLKDRNLPTPTAFYADESCTVFPSPYLVVAFIDGQTIDQPANAIEFVRQMAEVLSKIHQFEATELPFLHDRQRVFAGMLDIVPAHLDESLSEGKIRSTLKRYWPPVRQNTSVLLHGDFWPGNIMWKEDRLVGVIDWEDAGIGDPLIDLGNGRLEILMLIGREASEEFTNHYKLLRPDLNYDSLPFWDLCAALRPAGKMTDWGLDDATLRQLQVGHKEFVDQAVTRLIV